MIGCYSEFYNYIYTGLRCFYLSTQWKLKTLSDNGITAKNNYLSAVRKNGISLNLCKKLNGASGPRFFQDVITQDLWIFYAINIFLNSRE